MLFMARNQFALLLELFIHISYIRYVNIPVINLPDFVIVSVNCSQLHRNSVLDANIVNNILPLNSSTCILLESLCLGWEKEN